MKSRSAKHGKCPEDRFIAAKNQQPLMGKQHVSAKTNFPSFTCQRALKDMLIGSSKAGDVCGGAAHVKPNQLQLLIVTARPLGGQGITHIPAASSIPHSDAPCLWF